MEGGGAGGGGGCGGAYAASQTTLLYTKKQSNRFSDFRDFVCSLFPKAILFDVYFTLSWCCAVWRPYKVSPCIIIVQVIVIFFGIIEPSLFILKIEYRLSRRWVGRGSGGGVCSFANYSVAYEETQ